MRVYVFSMQKKSLRHILQLRDLYIGQMSNLFVRSEHQFITKGERDCFGSVGNAQFGENIADVGSRR